MVNHVGKSNHIQCWEIKLILRPSGAPESLLHLIFGKPSAQPGTYSHLSSPTLDSGNNGTSGILQKGFTSVSCFAFDTFSRRTHDGSDLENWNIWNVDDEWNDNWDELHHEYGKLGGEVTIIFGNTAFLAYQSVVIEEGLSLMTIKPTGNVQHGCTVMVECTPV